MILILEDNEKKTHMGDLSVSCFQTVSTDGAYYVISYKFNLHIFVSLRNVTE